jgi:hypothetical protein
MDADDPRLSAVAAIYDSMAHPGSMLADLLDLHAARTGENSARHAAKVLRGAVKAGRRGIDDTRALQRIMAQPPSKRRHAVRFEAKFLAGPGASEREIASTAKRLRRKMRKKDVCISSER